MTTRAQMHVRLSRYLKSQPLNLAVHPKAIDDALEVAMARGWTDAEWLATYALEGCDHPSVNNPAAVFVHRLNEAAAMPCPGASDGTPVPPAYSRERVDYCESCGEPSGRHLARCGEGKL